MSVRDGLSKTLSLHRCFRSSFCSKLQFAFPMEVEHAAKRRKQTHSKRAPAYEPVEVKSMMCIS